MQKKKIKELVDLLPDEFDVDAFLDQVMLLNRIEAAERRLASGEGVSHDEAKNRMEKWIK